MQATYEFMTTASLTWAKVPADCMNNYNSQACANDMSTISTAMDGAAHSTQKEIVDCWDGDITSPCALDLMAAADDLDNAAQSMTSTVADCKVNWNKCIEDWQDASKSYMAYYEDSVRAYDDCKKQEITGKVVEEASETSIA